MRYLKVSVVISFYNDYLHLCEEEGLGKRKFVKKRLKGNGYMVARRISGERQIPGGFQNKLEDVFLKGLGTALLRG